MAAANQAPAPRVTQRRCSGPTASVKITAQRAATEAALARAIVVLRGGDLDHLVAESVSVPRPPHAGDPTLDALPSDVKHALAAGESTCFEMSPSRLPPATQLVPFAELRGAVTTGRADWPAFRSRFPDARMWFGFSPAVLSGDGRHAVVFYERTCPGRCGEAEWVWFTRDAQDAPWRIAKEWWDWVS